MTERYSHLPWHTGPVPAETPTNEYLLVRDSGGGIERGLLTKTHCYVGGAAYKRDLDPQIHSWVAAWCLLSDIDALLVTAG